MRFQLKFTLALVGAILVGLTIFGAFTLQWSEERVLDAELERGEHVTESTVLAFTVIAFTLEREANILADTESISGGLTATGSADGPAMGEVLREAIDGDDVMSTASVFDRDGRLVASTQDDLIGQSAATTPDSVGQLPELDDLTEPVSQVVLDGLAVGVVAFAPVTVDDDVVGAVQVGFEPALVQNFLEDQRYGESGEAMLGLRDRDGTVVMLQLADGGVEITSLPAASSDHPVVAAIADQEVDEVDVRLSSADEPAVVVARPVPDLAVAVVSRIDRAEVVGQVSDVRNALLLVGGALLGTALLAGLVLGRRVAAQLAEQERAQARFTSMFTAAPMAMVAVDGDGRIRLANDRAAGLLGYTVEQLCQMDVESLVPHDSREHHVGLRDGFFETRRARTMRPGQDVVAVTADGREVPVEVSLTPIDTDEGTMVIAALVDLTERKRAERVLADRAEALTRSNRDLDDFAYVAAHDLKAPLRAMGSLAGFVMEDLGEELPDQARNDLDEIRERARKLMSLLDGLLQYARVGRDHGEPTEVDLNDVLEEMVPIYVPRERFEVDVAPDLPAVHAPQAAVELVLRNLLMNTVKHHDRETGRISVSGRVTEGQVRLTVADDGPGILPEFTTKVFQLYGTLKHADQGEGSGLGLALIKRTIEACDGSIELLPRDGRGATFEVVWPAVTPGSSEEAASPELVAP